MDLLNIGLSPLIPPSSLLKKLRVCSTAVVFFQNFTECHISLKKKMLVGY
jgi:hypothetical protein